MKDKHCFNCGDKLSLTDSYCSNCGQQVDDNNLRLRAVFREFIENYLSFDTKLGRTILPFLFQPGKLASEFIKGKRVHFVNPFRFYLLISIFFFFILGAFIDKEVKRAKPVKKKDIVELTNDKASGLSNDLKDFTVLIDSLEKVDSFLVQEKMDSLIKANKLEKTLSYTKDTATTKDSGPLKNNSFVTKNSSGWGFNINITKLNTLKEYRYNNDYSDEALLDSLQTDSLGKYERILALQTIKMYRSNSKVITRFILGNLSLGMLALIPGLALFFFIFYYKKEQTFVAHLIHSLQVHTFSLFLYGLAILLMYFFMSSAIVISTFVISAIYLFFSMKKVYQTAIFPTLWRYVSIGMLYFIYWIFAITVGIIISFLLF